MYSSPRSAASTFLKKKNVTHCFTGLPRHKTIYVSAYYYICVLMLLYVSSVRRQEYTYAQYSLRTRTALPVLLYVCPHTTICVSSYNYICVLSARILLAAHTYCFTFTPSNQKQNLSLLSYCILCARVFSKFVGRGISVCVCIYIYMYIYK